MSKKASKTLTQNMKLVLAYIRLRIKKTSESPKVREVADQMGWSSTATAAGVIKSLQDRGLLKRQKYARKIKIVKPAGKK